MCYSVGSFKKALKTFLFKKDLLLSKNKTNLFMMVCLEIGSKILRFYLSNIFPFKGNFQIFLL